MLRFLTLLACGLQVTAFVSRGKIPAPYHRPNADLIDDEYNVILHDGYTIDAHFAHIGRNLTQTGEIIYYIERLNAYVAKLDSHTVHELVRSDPGVELVEHNTAIEPIYEHSKGEATRPNHGLSRRAGLYSQLIGDYWPVQISSPTKLTGNYLPAVYETIDNGGNGVNVYILDTGVRITHQSFNKKFNQQNPSRASNFRGATTSKYCGNEPMTDNKGHGTHVASILGDRAEGIALQANIINVKVICDKSRPTLGGIATAIMDVVSDHDHNIVTQDPLFFRGSVINMSLRGGDTTLFQRAVQTAFSSGISMAVAAGNDGEDVKQRPQFAPCKYTGSVVCVGASDINYNKASFSNFGSLVTMIAPGKDITAAGIKSDTDLAKKSGTSMATPMVAGFMATIVGFERLKSARDVYTRVSQNTLNGVISGFSSDTNTAFLNNGIRNSGKSGRDPYLGIPTRTRTGFFLASNGTINNSEDQPSSSSDGSEVQTFDPNDLTTNTADSPVDTDTASFEGDDTDENDNPDFTPPTTFEKWNSGFCTSNSNSVFLSECLELIAQVQSDLEAGNSETYICPPSTPFTPTVKTVNGCSLTLVADNTNSCISTSDAFLFLTDISFCSADDSAFSGRADVSDASFCIDGNTDGSGCTRTDPNALQFQFYLGSSDGSPSGDGTGGSCAGTPQGKISATNNQCTGVPPAGFGGIQLESGPKNCRLELFSDSNCQTELPIQSNANVGSCIANADVPAAQGIIFAC